MIFEFVNKDEVKKLMSDEIISTALPTMPNSYDGRLLIEEIAGVCEQNVYSGKNKLLYPYQETSKTVSGITFTDLGDGRIKAKGTSTARVSFAIHGRTAGEANDFALPNGDYIFSGCPSGGSATTYRINFGITKNGSYVELGSDQGSGYSFTASGDDFSENSVNMGIAIDILSGQTVDLIFEPMIRLASVTDDTYESYVGGIPSPSPSYPQEIKNSVVNEIKTQNKNLIPYPYDYTTMTANGITWTDLGDGRVMANGTATADSPFNCQNRTDTETPFILPVGTYILSGCPSGGSGSTYRNLAGRTNPETGAHEAFATDTGNGATFTITEESTTTQIQLMIKKGTTVNNLIFEPMLRRADNTDDTFEPYKATTVTLSQPIELNRVEVSADDAYTYEKDGKYYIADTIEKIDGEYKKVQRIKKLILNGSETWYKSSDTSCDIYSLSNYDENKGKKTICSHFKQSDIIEVNRVYVHKSLRLYFCFAEYGTTTIQDWTNWLSENNVSVQFIAETIITSLPTADQIALNSLETYNGITYLEFDSEVEPVFSVDYGTSKAGAMALDTLLSGEVTELNVGDLTALETEAKGSIVLAINELHRGLSGIDSTLVAMATTETY